MGRDPKAHLTDEEFVWYVDGEVPADCLPSLREHIETCEQCACELEEYFDRDGCFPEAEWARMQEEFLDRLDSRLVSETSSPSDPSTEFPRTVTTDREPPPPLRLFPGELPDPIFPPSGNLQPMHFPQAMGSGGEISDRKRTEGVVKTKFGEVEWRCARNSDDGLTLKVVVFTQSERRLAQLDGRSCELWRRDMTRHPWKCLSIQREAADRVAGTISISRNETAELSAKLVFGITVPLHAVCLVVDCSSGATNAFLSVLRRSLCQLFTESDFISQDFLAAVKLGIVQFGLDDEESVVCELSPDMDLFYRGLARLRVGGTAGHVEEVIDKAAKMLGDGPPGVERSLVILTPVSGQEQIALAAARAKLKGISVHAIDGSMSDLAEVFAGLTNAMQL